jgi:putative peptidoglycan lipid II flippase
VSVVPAAHARSDPRGSEQSAHRRLVRATGVWSFWTLVSRIAGFAREVLLARAFGTSLAASSLVVAQTVPNLMRTLVSEEVARGAVLPLVTEELVADEDVEAWRLTTATAAWATVLMGVISVAVWFAAEASVRLVAPGIVHANASFAPQAARILHILLPLVLASGITAASSAYLVAKRRFGIAGIAMVGANVPLVATLLFVRHPSVELAAALVTAGAVLQAAIQAWAAIRLRSASGFWWTARHLRVAGRLAIPVVLTLGAASFSGLIDVAFASTVGTGGPAALDKAIRLMLVPYGVFAVAVGVVAMPSLVEAALAADSRFDRELVRATQLQGAMLVPAALLLGLAATPVVSLVYRHGAFGAASTRLTANALIGFAFVLPAIGLSLIGSRAWLSQKRAWLPAACSLIGLALNGLLDWAFVGPFGLLGIGLSTAAVHGALGTTFIIGAARDRRRVAVRLGVFSARLLVTSIAAVACALAVVHLAAFAGTIGAGVFALAAGGVVLVGAASLVRLDEYAQIVASLKPPRTRGRP